MEEESIKTKGLSTESYKGVRDFYPEEMFVQKYLFATMRKAVEHFGYVEYGASILEPTELYRAKSSEEIVKDQTYSFTDRGERDVTLRPEMTPTLARMVAAKKRALSFPLRWYSIPNLFRYEKPQRGRLREHFQLNVDLFGIPGVEAEKEIISLAAHIMDTFGAKPADYEIRINNRKLLQNAIEKKLTHKSHYPQAIRLLDKKDKMSAQDFDAEWKKISSDMFELIIEADEEIKEVIAGLKAEGISNVVFWPTLARGFDYYTGIVFEVFDTHKDNPRSLFGGGRYDDLLAIFGSEKAPAIGFGMGDVTLRDFLETHQLLPAYTPSAHLSIVHAAGASHNDTNALAMRLREEGINVAMDLSTKKIGDQIKKASKDSIPYVLVVGEKELKEKSYNLKNLVTGEEKSVTEVQLIHELRRI